jgi:hypothetical protein
MKRMMQQEKNERIGFKRASWKVPSIQVSSSASWNYRAGNYFRYEDFVEI